jgi:hypothetical protein
MPASLAVRSSLILTAAGEPMVVERSPAKISLKSTDQQPILLDGLLNLLSTQSFAAVRWSNSPTRLA